MPTVRPTLRAQMAVLCATVLLVVPAARAQVVVPSVHIDNFGKVSSTYYRGAQPEGRDYTDLASLGVKTVINLTSDDADASEQGQVERAGMKYVHIPMNTHRNPTQAQLTQFLALVNDPASQPVYVHCVGGRHRTGVMTAVYRMTQEGWTGERAFQEMKRYKYGADFLHSEFKQFVLNFKPATTATVATTAAAPAAPWASAAPAASVTPAASATPAAIAAPAVPAAPASLTYTK